MNYEMLDEIGRVIAHVCDDPPSIVVADPADPYGVRAWSSGIPALVGSNEGDAQVELETTIPDTNEFWGLALMEAVEYRNWKLVNPESVLAAEFKEDLHPRNSKGTEHGGQFTSKDEEQRVKIPKLDLDIADMTKIGGSLGGSTPGAQYKDKDGTVWYVKSVQSTGHAMNEALAARLYNLAGVDCVEVHTCKNGDGIGVASKVIQLAGGATYNTPGATEGFAADAWLGNWDVCGASFDNLQIDKDGKAVRIDVGGSMVFRAKGGDKAAYFQEVVGEVNSLRDPSGKNPTTPKVFGPMSPDEVKASIQNTVANVTDAQIDKVVDGMKLNYGFQGKIGPLDLDDLKKRLKERRDYLVKLAKNEKPAEPGKPKESKPPNIKGAIYSANKPVFGTKTGIEGLAPVPDEPKPKLSSGPQLRCMKDASESAGGFKFDISNWDHENHPRPDANGVPTNAKSMEFKRLVTIGHAMCASWKGSAQSEAASALKRAAQRVFNADGIIYNNTTQDDKKIQWDNDRVARMMYRDTQARLEAAGLGDEDRVELYRGINKAITTPGILEGYSYSLATAKKFNGHDVVERHVHPSEIMIDNKSSFFKDTGYTEETEWFVFAGGFGSVESHVASAKDKGPAPSPVHTGGIVSYAVAKPPGVKGTKPGLTGSIKPKQNITPAPQSHPIMAEVKAEKEASKWAKVNDDLILKVKQAHALGHKASIISKVHNIAPSTIHGIIHGTAKAYSDVGPRTKNLKSLLQVTDAQWKTVKENVASALKMSGSADFKAIGEAAGLKEWKARAIWFAKKKDNGLI